MSDLPSHPIRFADLPARRRSHFLLEPDAPARKALAAKMDLLALRKLKFEGALIPMGKRDWRIEAKMGATVHQACVITLEPVSSRIDEQVERTFIAEYEKPEKSKNREEVEIEVSEDDTSDTLPDTLDLYDVVMETLLLTLPPYPRIEGAETGTDGRAMFTEPGKAVMTDEDARPFAGLQALRDSLETKDDDKD